MMCPQCGSDDLSMIDSRTSNDQVNRRRLCLNCLCRFSTVEIKKEELQRLRRIENVAYKLQEEFRFEK